MGVFKRWRERGQRAKSYAQAERHIASGDLAAALAELLPLLDADAGDQVVALKVVEAYAELGEADSASERLADLIQADPRQVALINNASFDDIRATDAFAAVYESAVAVITAALEDNPDDAQARFLLAEHHEALGNTLVAHGEYALLRRDDDVSVRSRANYMDARLSATEGVVDNAATCLREAISENPSLAVAAQTDPAFDDLLASGAVGDMRELAAAAEEKTLRRQMAETPDNPVPRRRLVTWLGANDRRDEALALATEALEDFPTDAELLEAHADCLFDLARYGEALGSYQEALRLHPGRTWPVYRAGAVYERQELPDAARSAYWDALDATRDDAGVALLIARGMARLDDVSGMYEALGRTVQLAITLREPSPEDVYAAVNSLEEFTAYRAQPEFRAIHDELQRECAAPAGEDDDEDWDGDADADADDFEALDL
jgi:tetratricopeptide (TPR) repeat protein